MALRLDYTLRKENPPRVSLAQADEMTLRYDCFCGDVTCFVDQADFSAHWGWVPVLDFALATRHAAREASRGESTSIDFTESDEEILIEPVTDSSELVMTSTYAPGRATIPASEFEAEAQDFLLRVVSELTARFPALSENAFVSTVWRQIEEQQQG